MILASGEHGLQCLHLEHHERLNRAVLAEREPLGQDRHRHVQRGGERGDGLAEPADLVVLAAFGPQIQLRRTRGDPAMPLFELSHQRRPQASSRAGHQDDPDRRVLVALSQRLQQRDQICAAVRVIDYDHRRIPAGPHGIDSGRARPGVQPPSRPVRREPGGELQRQPRLAHPRRAADHHDRAPPLTSAPPGQLAKLTAPPAERHRAPPRQQQPQHVIPVHGTRITQIIEHLTAPLMRGFTLIPARINTINNYPRHQRRNRRDSPGKPGRSP